ncbi:helix-turn-helix transcriptional regulator [Sphingomonas sp. 37zxx]|uniref:helix-turn-helix transcriptional regulator n=1 Tax=Sphingomonas sp. 37zxx TaxID=1550073 RepID=UPI00053BF765|nr:helix-turn-helix transcriptional regulator [Sphingomonas sp. 37zxx]
MTAQILEISGQKMALLPIADYERLVDIAEDRSDVVAACAAEARRADGEEDVPIAIVDRLLAGEHPLRVWREHRGFKQVEFAHMVGCEQSMVSRIEAGDRIGSIELWKKIAKVLAVSIDDLQKL